MTVVPGDSAPGNEADGCTFVAVTVIVNEAADAPPPLSLTTCLITMSFGWMSSFVIEQVAVCPRPSVIWFPTCVPPTHVQELAA